MAKIKRPETKILYDITSLFIILFFLKEVCKVLSPTWKQGIFWMTAGCYGTLAIIGAILFYYYIYYDKTARRLKDLFYYYNIQGMDGFPKYCGKKEADYMWLYQKEIKWSKSDTKESDGDDKMISPFEESSSLKEFIQNNHNVMRYYFTLPTGITMSELGKKLEGIVLHLERDTILVYEQHKFIIVVGDRVHDLYLQKR